MSTKREWVAAQRVSDEWTKFIYDEDGSYDLQDLTDAIVALRKVFDLSDLPTTDDDEPVVGGVS